MHVQKKQKIIPDWVFVNNVENSFIKIINISEMELDDFYQNISTSLL